MTAEYNDLVGSRVLVGVTCLDPEGHLLTQFQTHGIVAAVREDAILVTRSDGSAYGLPPAPELFEVAEPGVYTMNETGESVEDPDFLASLTVTIHDPASLTELRDRGFVAPES